MKTRSIIPMAFVILSFTLAASAADWPQWRGPQRDGISKETGLLPTWPKDGPKLLWKVFDAGEGYSTPAVKGNRLYILGSKGMEDEFMQARDIKDGHIIWTVRLGKVGPNQMANFPGCRSTPTVDGDFIYALGSDGDLVCVKAADGAEVWRKNMRSNFGGEPGLWAYAESPLIDGDVLACTPGGQEAAMVALSKKTGAVIWKTALAEDDNAKAAYSSIIVVHVGGLKQYVQFVSTALIGVDAKTGKSLWRYEKTAANSMANIPTPVAGGSLIYSSTGQGTGGVVDLKVDKGSALVNELYTSKALPNSIGGSVLFNGFLYGTNNKGLMCIEFATGKQKWQQESDGSAGSVCYADGRLYVHLENGDLILAEANADAYKEVGRFSPPDLPKRTGMIKAWAYPVVANGNLYVRDLEMLWCYDVKGVK
jgi:outer membrane protein assembly factor BamB